jgi:hypothetical protein
MSDHQQLDEMKESIADLDGQGKEELAATAVQQAHRQDKKQVAAAAVQAVPDEDKKDLVAAAARSLPAEDQRELARSLVPDQRITNEVWLTIVKTFAGVLIAATLALIGAVFVSSFRAVDAAMVQILLTIFTTVAGILAGFISGRTSVGGTAR